MLDILDNKDKLTSRDSIEQQVQKQEQVELKHEGSLRPHRNHRVYVIHIETLEIKEAEYVKRKRYRMF